MLVTRSLDLRYAGQNYEITTPFGDGGLPALRAAFEQRHRQLYGYATGESVECVNLRVAAIGADDWAARRRPALPASAPAAASAGGIASRVLSRDGRGDAAPPRPRVAARGVAIADRP